LVILALVAAACGGDAEPESAAAAVPTEAVARWFEAVDAGDVEAVDGVVVDGSLAFVLALENRFEAAQIAALVDGGVPDEVAARYWESFANGFSEFSGRPVGTLTVGDYREFESEGETFAAVSVRGATDRGAIVFTRQLEDGGWAVDLVATLSPGFVSLLRRNLDGLPQGAEGDRVRSAYQTVIAPSIWAALAAGEFDDAFARDALNLLEAIEAA
jgi:hypothetical protein